MSQLDELRTLLARHHQGVLATIRANGRPQMSNIAYGWDGDHDLVRISVTATRVKARNLGRDPRASLHVTTDDFWHWAVADGTADLSPVSTEPGDATGRELLELHDQVGTPHPDPDEFFAAMVQDQRRCIRLHVEHLYGQP